MELNQTPEDELLKQIESYFKQKGWEYTRVPASNKTRRPDLQLNLNNETVTIELKQRLGNPQKNEEIKESLKETGQWTTTETLQSNRSASKIIESSIDQLNSLECNFKITWINFENDDAKLNEKLTYYTIYGIKDIFDFDNKVLKKCFYYEPCSSFYVHRNTLDGVVLSKGQDAYLCLNNLSPRFDILLKSSFVNAFESALKNPIEMEINDEIFLINPHDLNNAKLDLLKSKYKLTNIAAENFKMTQGWVNL